jgi:hypothetical protein
MLGGTRFEGMSGLFRAADVGAPPQPVPAVAEGVADARACWDRPASLLSAAGRMLAICRASGTSMISWAAPPRAPARGEGMAVRTWGVGPAAAHITLTLIKSGFQPRFSRPARY